MSVVALVSGSSSCDVAADFRVACLESNIPVYVGCTDFDDCQCVGCDPVEVAACTLAGGGGMGVGVVC